MVVAVPPTTPPPTPHFIPHPHARRAGQDGADDWSASLSPSLPLGTALSPFLPIALSLAHSPVSLPLAVCLLGRVPFATRRPRDAFPPTTPPPPRRSDGSACVRGGGPKDRQLACPHDLLHPHRPVSAS